MQVISASHPTQNIGDFYARAANYFPQFDGEQFDYCTITQEQCQGKAIILGGTGCLMTKAPARIDAVRSIAKWGARTVAWAVGTNDDNYRLPDYSALQGYGLVGVRDFGQVLRWVPCPSCMHPAFDQDYPAQHELVTYSHKKFDLTIPGIPNRTNCEGTITDAIQFLASGDTVLTSSYHGAYWATLLGCKVVVIEPFASKFLHYKHMPVLARKEDWKAAVKQARWYPEALAECRHVNRDFANQVSMYLGG